MEVTDELVFDVFRWLDIPFQNSNDDFIQLPTVCHGGSSHKLYYYKNTKKLVCFTNCGTMDIFRFVSKVKGISNKEAFKLIVTGFDVESSHDVQVEYNPSDKFERATESVHKDVKSIDNNVLNHFYPFAIEKWKEENINYDTQHKFEIRYSIEDNAIIIPHRDQDGNLVGIRQRNLNRESVDRGIKYVPTRLNGTVFKYPTGENLYGYFYNKEEIIKSKKIILFEAEKSVMMMDTFYNDNNYSVALSGHNLSKSQIDFLYTLPVDEIIIGLDKDYKDDDIETKQALEELIIKKYRRLTNRFNVSVLWDNDNLLGYKDSPTDQGKEIFDQLMRERRYISNENYWTFCNRNFDYVVIFSIKSNIRLDSRPHFKSKG